MDSINKKIGKFKIVYREEGLLGALRYVMHFFISKTGFYLDKWILGRFIEVTGNTGYLNGCRFDLSSLLIKTTAKSSFIQGTYEKDERRAIRRFLNRSLPVIELGASIGVVACVTNKILKNPKDHVVVEANPNLIPILSRNRELNHSSFTILNKASGYGASELTFYVNEKFLSGSVQRQKGTPVSVPTITLAEIFSEYKFEYANLICDIEGGELDLIENEKELLAKRVFQIILEVHPSLLGEDKVEDLRKQLEGVGFRKVRTGVHSTVLVFENNNLKI